MPTGAMKVSLDFSAASIRTTNTRYDVKNISANKPWAMFIPGARVVFKDSMSPGNMAFTTPPAAMQEMICVGTRNAARIHGSWPLKHMPSTTYKR